MSLFGGTRSGVGHRPCLSDPGNSWQAPDRVSPWTALIAAIWIGAVSPD